MKNKKYDLNRMRKEILEDEKLDRQEAQAELSQEDIMKMLSAKKGTRKKKADGKNQ
jgi:hypothetical protein